MKKPTDIYVTFTQFVESKGLSASTKEQYLRQLQYLARYYPAKPLEHITEKQVSDYLIHRRDEQEVRPSTLSQSLVAIRSLYRDLLGKDWKLWHAFKVPSDKPSSSPSTTHNVKSPSASQTTPPTHSDRPLGHRVLPDPLTYDHLYDSMKRYAQLLALHYDCLRTRHAYYRQLNLVQRHFDCDPELLTEDDVRDYLLFVKFEKHWKPKTIRQAVACLKCFFYELLKQGPWDVFSQIRTKDHDTVPVVLSRQQVHDLIANIRLRRYRTPIKLIYCSGLRLSECLSLTIHDIQSKEGKLRIRQGKGMKDRIVPIAQEMLEDLRVYYRFHRNPLLIFPNVGRGVQHGPSLSERMRNATMPMPHGSLQRLLVVAREQLQIPDAKPHTLRIDSLAPARSGRCPSTSCCPSHSPPGGSAASPLISLRTV